MMSNVIHLPRPPSARSGLEPLAFFVRAGWNDHKELLELITSGERGTFGFVVDAQNSERHKDLIIEGRKRDFDVILDPKTQQLAFPGSYSDALNALPWGGTDQYQGFADYSGQSGERRAAQIVEFALVHRFTQILGPSHLLTGPNDPWLRRDIEMMNWAARRIGEAGSKLGLIYSLAMPIAVFRDDALRGAIIAAISNVPCDAIWLKVENFGDDATGEKEVAYIKACQDFHARGLPLIADHAGGLPGLGTLAFGATGGVAHGVTVNQGFKASSWRRPPKENNGGMAPRVYLPQLDMMIKRAIAREFIASSLRVRGRHICKDPHCCTRPNDMFDRPVRHALYQRAREVENLSKVPVSVRAASYMDNVRRISDEVAVAASFEKIGDELKNALQLKQKKLGHFRDAMAHLAATTTTGTVALPPLRRALSGRGSQ